MAMVSNNDTFWYLILADLLHTALLVGFFYQYRKARKSGESILAFTDMKSKAFWAFLSDRKDWTCMFDHIDFEYTTKNKHIADNN